ncbi:tandem-95 repeat protein [Candidatus Parabeggiatoa sp. HSG14]|uniref:tandem-95 repeat protein n=1 Tax=Candidatus Parabeggiatoa sp. HSG14 TaxID=3055593 RepID=UPI0025A8F24F|nr:tandem-95 repeat protein [Thiotrichales bacterium HSG14]
MKNNLFLGILLSAVMSNIVYAQDCDLIDSAEYDDLSYLCNEPEDTVAEYPEGEEPEDYLLMDWSIPSTTESSTSEGGTTSNTQTPSGNSSTDKTSQSSGNTSKTAATGVDKPSVTTESDKPIITEKPVLVTEKPLLVEETTNNSSNEVVHWVTSHSGRVIIIYLKANPNYGKAKKLTFTVYPRHGQVKDNKDDTLGYTPNEGFTGEDSLTYRLTDTQGNKSDTTVNIVVKDKESGNLSKVNFSDKADHKLEINHGEWTVIDISANYDPNAQQKLSLNPSENGQVIDNQNATLTYIPNKDFSGVDRFTYTVTHANGKTYTFIVIIRVGILSYTYQTVERVVKHSSSADHFVTTNLRSVAIIDIRKHYKPDHYLYLVLGLSPDDHTLNGQVVDNEDGTLIYIPEEGFIGIDTFTYIVINKNKKTYNTFKVKVEVRGENRILPVKCDTMYVVQDQDVKDSQILTIDPDTYIIVELGPLYYGLDLEGMAIDPINQLLYAVSGSGGPSKHSHFDGYLYLVNPQTGALKFIGDTGFRELTALAFHPDGTLWAWSAHGAKNQKKGKGGIIQIDPETAQSDLLFPSTLPGKSDIEGLAWNTNGTLLYGSENSNLWTFDGKKFKQICDNFPSEIEALETLSDGMLMLAADNYKGNTVFVYSPDHCKIIFEDSFITNKHYEDLESIAWPLKCQVPSQLSNWEAQFNDGNEKKVCSNKSQWLTMTGKVRLEPSDTLAYIETYWQLLSPKNAPCPPSQMDNIGYSVESEKSENCKEVFYQSQFIMGGETGFSIKGWWPGISEDAEEDKLVKTRYGINVYDMDRNPLSVGKITKIVSGKPSICAEAVNQGDKAASTEKTSKTDRNTKSKETTKKTTAKNTKGKETAAKNTKTKKSNDNKSSDKAKKSNDNKSSDKAKKSNDNKTKKSNDNKSSNKAKKSNDNKSDNKAKKSNDNKSDNKAKKSNDNKSGNKAKKSNDNKSGNKAKKSNDNKSDNKAKKSNDNKSGNKAKKSNDNKSNDKAKKSNNNKSNDKVKEEEAKSKKSSKKSEKNSD